MKIVKILFANIPSTLLVLFFSAFSMGQLQRVQLSPHIAVYAHDIIVITFIAWTFLKNKKIQRKIKIIPEKLKKIISSFPLEAAWIFWIALGMVIGLGTGTLAIRSLLYFMRLCVYIVFAVLVKSLHKETFSAQKTMAWLGLLMAGWGMAQYFWLPDTRFLHIFGWDNHYYRLIGTFFDPAFTGMMLVLTFGLWQLPEVFRGVPKMFSQLVQVSIALAVSATFSRASYLALAVLISLHVLHKKITPLFALVLASVFSLFLLLLPKPGGEGVNLARTSTGEARLENAQQNLVALEGAQWIWGRGLFNTDNTIHSSTPHHASFPDSLPILILNATGVVGTILTTLISFKWLTRWWSTKPIWTSMLLATLIHSIFNNTLLQPFIFLALWLAF